MSEDSKKLVKAKETGLAAVVNHLFGQPTPRNAIKSRPGPAGKTISYVSIGYVINELNNAFGPFWEFKVVDKSVGKSQIWVQGQLTVKDPKTGFTVTKETFGGSDIKMRKDTGEPIDIANDLKAAVSDCTKKCASMFGIAADVFYKDMEQYEQMPNVVDVEEGEDKSLRALLTSKLFAIGSEKGLTADHVKDTIKKYFGVEHMADLTSDQIKAGITVLEKKPSISNSPEDTAGGIKGSEVVSSGKTEAILEVLSPEGKKRCSKCMNEFDPEDFRRDTDSKNFCSMACQSSYYPSPKEVKAKIW